MIFSDEFTNGKHINNLVTVELPLYSKRNILVKVQKYNVSYEAHRYLKSLKDAIGTVITNESIVLGPAREPGFDIKKLEEVWLKFEAART